MNNKIKITYESHGETRTTEISGGSNLPVVIRELAYLLEAGGFPRDSITELIRDEDGTPVWEWDV